MIICFVCTVKKPSMLSLNGEHRLILEAIVSTTLNLTQLQNFQLFICEDCKCLIDSVLNFKNVALVGASKFLTKLASMQKENNQRLPVENPSLLPVTQDPHNLLEERSFVPIKIEVEQVPPPVEGTIKTECPDYEDGYGEPPAPARETICQAGFPAIIHTATLNPMASMPMGRMPTLVLHPLTVTGRGDRAATDRHTDSPLLSTEERLSATLPARALSPLPLGSSTLNVKTESDETPKETSSIQKQPSQERRNVNAKRLRLFPLVPWGCVEDNSEWLAKQKEIKERIEKKRQERQRPKYPTYYHCSDCNFVTRDRAVFLPHHCSEEDIEKAKKLANRKRLKKRPAGAIRRSDWNARFVCESSASNQRRSIIRPHACPICPATFKTKAALYMHRRLKHRKEKKQENGEVKDELSVALEALESSMQYQF